MCCLQGDAIIRNSRTEMELWLEGKTFLLERESGDENRQQKETAQAEAVRAGSLRKGCRGERVAKDRAAERIKVRDATPAGEWAAHETQVPRTMLHLSVDRIEQRETGGIASRDDHPFDERTEEVCEQNPP